MPMKSKILIVLLVVCSVLGTVFTRTLWADSNGSVELQIEKFSRIIRFAQLYYVEDVDWDKAMEGAISGMLENMDPHSVYISEDEVREYDESFSGQYEGIGIEYEIIDGYITVIAPIPGAPSEALGIQIGDRIKEINGESAYNLTQEDVTRKLKGPKGSTVDVRIERDGVDDLLDFSITRDVVPITTVRASFMVDDSTGYIWVTRFAAITADELEEKLIELEAQNMKRLVLDFRWNSGGYLYEAVNIAGKFIKGHSAIVSTRGRGTEAETLYANQFGRTMVRNYPIVILQNRGSASASEVVAGAIQDYDRGLIVGETSFGKGLVQKQFPLPDGSAVRVTIAKYYTPSGRCIQREYKGKEIDEYYAQSGDSLADDLPDSERPVFYTLHEKRPVYGDGGIEPDVHVENEIYSRSPQMTSDMFEKRLFFDFSHQYTVQHPELKSYGLQQFSREFRISDQLLREYKRFCEAKGLDLDQAAFDGDIDFLRSRLRAEIARQLWDTDGYYFLMTMQDTQFRTALSVIDSVITVQ